MIRCVRHWTGDDDNSLLRRALSISNAARMAISSPASPGASTAAAIMIKVLELCFGKELAGGGWKAKLEAIIPSYGHLLIDDAALTRKVRADTAAVLGLQNV
jgi:L-2-hydroxyglutarate oxidase LhgO